MTLEDEARAAYAARSRSNKLPSLEEDKLLAEAKKVYKEQLAKENIIQKFKRKYSQVKEDVKELNDDIGKNTVEMIQQFGDKGLDAALMTGSMLESPVHALDYGIRKITGDEGPGLPWGSDLAREAVKKLQNRDIRAEPTSYGGHIGAGVGTAVGSLIPGMGAAVTAESLAAPTIAKATPKVLQQMAPTIRQKFAQTAGKLAEGMATKEAAALTGIGGLASGQLRSMGVDPAVADVAGGLFPVAAQATMAKGAPALANTFKWAKGQFLPSVEQTYERAADKLSGLMGKQYSKGVANLEKFNLADFPEGYHPTTAEVADSSALAAEQRRRRDVPFEGGNEINDLTEANNAILNKNLADLGPGVDPGETKTFVENYNQTRPQQLAALERDAEIGLGQHTREIVGERGSRQAAGNAIQNAEQAELTIADQARAPAREQYEAIEQATDHIIGPSDTIAAVENEMTSAKGKALTALRRVRGYLNSNQGNFIPGAEGQAIPALTPLELHNVRRQISDDMQASFRAGRTAEGNALRRVRGILDTELAEKYPALNEARQQYRAASGDYNALAEHPAIGRDLERGEFNEGFSTQASKVVDKYISGPAAVENATALRPILDRNPQAAQQAEYYINDLLLNELFDKNGNVTTSSVDAWRRKNAGAFIIDPNLNNKLSTTQNARAYVNSLGEANKLHLRELQTSAAKDMLNSDPNRLVKGIFEKRNTGQRIDDALSLVRRDPTGMAEEGLKQAIVDEIKDKVNSLAHGNTGVKVAEYHKFFEKNKAHLGKMFDNNQLKVLEQIDNTLLGRNKVETLGKNAGSETAGKNVLGMVMRGAWGKVPASIRGPTGMAAEGLYYWSNKKMQDVITQAMIDPKFAEQLLKRTAMKEANEALKGVKYIGKSAKEAKYSSFTYKQAESQLEKLLKQSYVNTIKTNSSKLQQRQSDEEDEDED